MEQDKANALREQLSALADGQLHAGECEQAMAALDVGATAWKAASMDWQAYHVIGDVLRCGDRAVSACPSDFLSRLQTRLRDEPALLPKATELPVPAVVHMRPQVEAANEGSFRWKLVAGMASFAAVAAIAWNVTGGSSVPQQPQLAAVPVTPPAVVATAAPQAAAAPASRTVEQPVTLASGEPQIMIRDARLDELLAAHKQVGSGAALQMPAAFLRSATLAGSER